MRRIKDKLGNFLILDDRDNATYVSIESCGDLIPNLGYIESDTKIYYTQGDPILISAKLLCETKSFNKVSISGRIIGLGSLRYLLHIPHGTQIKSFAELIQINPDIELVQFKDKLDAIFQMTTFYSDYLKTHPSELKTAKIGAMVIEDTSKFLDSSFETINSWIGKKKDPSPYFLHLVEYYNFCVK